MNGFSKSLIDCRFGKRIRRTGWAEGQWVQYQQSPQDLLFRDADGSLAPWPITTADVLATDWSTLPAL
jgi:hypothetical protein